MKRILTVFTILILPFCIFASQFHSVPLDSPAYRIIDSAQIRGIIKPQSDVRPYNLDVVTSLLEEIRKSDLVSDSEKEYISQVLDSFSPYLKTAAIGMQFSDETRVGKDLIDSRNKITAFFRGDFLGVVSFDMNISGHVDRIDRKAFVFTDFSTEADGAYMNYLGKGEKNASLPRTKSDSFYAGLSGQPELSVSVKNGLFSARFAAIQHDWGVGDGNLALSETARNMDAVEFTIKPADWVEYTVLTGSLGKFSFYGEENWPSDDWHEDIYDNNIAIHRVELGPFSGLKASVWEACVYRKRFELAYLNPFQIYLFAQNNLGDFDNALVGADLSWTFKNIGTFYAALSADEFNKPSKFFSCPRNIVALQAGFKTGIKLFDFTVVSAQATYIPAFFGTHYGYNLSNGNNPWGRNDYKTTYVNKGQNLGYNLDPDSLELMLKAETSVKGINFEFKFREQLRSYQYATDPVNGQNMLTTVFYGNYNSDFKDNLYGDYSEREFFKNIGEIINDISFEAEKEFANLPLSVSLGFDVIIDSQRSIVNYDSIKVPAKASKNGEFINPGYNLAYSDWTTSAKVLACVGFKVFY